MRHIEYMETPTEPRYAVQNLSLRPHVSLFLESDFLPPSLPFGCGVVLIANTDCVCGVRTQLESLQVRKQNLLQLIWTRSLPRCVLLQRENLDPPFFTENFAKIEQPQGLRH